MRQLPRHIAIVMDGNGRWAKAHRKPRAMGHKAGVSALKKVVQACAKKEIKALTVFAFSTENWQRPEKEVSLLFELFMRALTSEVQELHQNNIRLQFIGDITAFSKSLQSKMQAAQALTENNTGLTFVAALNYGGRWDITQAVKKIAAAVHAGDCALDSIDEDLIQQQLSTQALPEPDLFIRTSGEQRISNFLNWQLAYTELYFTETLWPDFDETALEDAIAFYASRERRFGLTSEQTTAC